MVDLLTGVRVTIRQPVPARVTIAYPVGPDLHVVPVVGPAGPPGGEFHLHTQTTPAATWVITHGLSTPQPHVSLVLTGETEAVETDTFHPSPGVTTLQFPSAESGTAYLS